MHRYDMECLNSNCKKVKEVVTKEFIDEKIHTKAFICSCGGKRQVKQTPHDFKLNI